MNVTDINLLIHRDWIFEGILRKKRMAMKQLTHYIIVRRDLPLGVLAAQTTHAAGESFYRFGIDEMRRQYQQWLRGGSFRARTRTIAVVLSARNETRLKWLERKLKEHKIKHKAIREPDAPWNGQLMAIGLYPCHRSELLAKLFKDYQLLRELDPDANDWFSNSYPDQSNQLEAKQV